MYGVSVVLYELAITISVFADDPLRITTDGGKVSKKFNFKIVQSHTPKLLLPTALMPQSQYRQYITQLEVLLIARTTSEDA